MWRADEVSKVQLILWIWCQQLMLGFRRGPCAANHGAVGNRIETVKVKAGGRDEELGLSNLLLDFGIRRRHEPGRVLALYRMECQAAAQINKERLRQAHVAP